MSWPWGKNGVAFGQEMVALAQGSVALGQERAVQVASAVLVMVGPKVL